MINCDVSVHTTVSKFYMQLSIVKKKKSEYLNYMANENIFITNCLDIK